MRRLILAVVATLGTAAANAECEYPDQDQVRIPSGRTASEAEMVQAIGEMKSFMAEMEAFRNCLDTELHAGEQPPAREAVQLHDLRFNASVSAEEEMAERLNTQIRLFKEQQSGK